MNRPLCIPHCCGVAQRAKKALNSARRNSNRSRPNIPLGNCMTSTYQFSQSTLPDTSDDFHIFWSRAEVKGKPMKKLLYLSMMALLLAAQPTGKQQDMSNGQWWLNASEHDRSGYVYGFGAGCRGGVTEESAALFGTANWEFGATYKSPSGRRHQGETMEIILTNDSEATSSGWRYANSWAFRET